MRTTWLGSGPIAYTRQDEPFPNFRIILSKEAFPLAGLLQRTGAEPRIFWERR